MTGGRQPTETCRRIRGEHQPGFPRGRRPEHRQPAIEGLHLGDHRHAIATALLAGGSRYAAPVLPPLRRTLTLQTDDAAPRSQRLHRGNAELDSLLHGEIHLVTGLEGLRQGNPERRFALPFTPLHQLGIDLILAHRNDTRRVLAPPPVEQRDRVTRHKTQRASGVTRRTVRQADHATTGKRLRAEKAGGIHRVIIGTSPCILRRIWISTMVALTPPACRFGWPAAEFSLPGTDGKMHSLASCRGPRGLLVAFICNHCPYVQAILDRLIRDATALQALGVGVVAISANDIAAYPEDGPQQMRELAELKGFPFPYLFDESQSVARAYEAICTPDFFGFNAALQLQYRGRLDASGRSPAAADAERELFLAMQQIARTGQGPERQHPAIGCSLKWKGA